MAKGFGWKQGNRTKPAMSPALTGNRFGWRGNKTFPMPHFAQGGVMPFLDPTDVGGGIPTDDPQYITPKFNPNDQMPWKNPQGPSNPGPPGVRTTGINPLIPSDPHDPDPANPPTPDQQRPPGGPAFLGPPVRVPEPGTPPQPPGAMPPPPIQPFAEDGQQPFGVGAYPPPQVPGNPWGWALPGQPPKRPGNPWPHG